MKKIRFVKNSIYSLLTAALVAVFFIVGLFTLGNPKTTGEFFILPKEKVAVYNVTYADGQKYIKDVYVNVGTVYAEKGQTVNFSVKTSTSSTSTSWSDLATLKLVNGEGEGAKDFAFNWLAVSEDAQKPSSTVKRISLTADASVEINEIVCVADNGEKLTLTANETTSKGLKAASLSAAFDKQGSFKLSDRGYDSFTQEEGAYLSAIRLIRSGKTSLAESVYWLPEDNNALALIFMAFGVWIFGDSPFALRIVPFSAATLTLFGLYLLFSLMLKDKKYGFIAAVVATLGGVTVSAGRLGSPYALITCSLVYSLYFAYKFYAKGISSSNVVLGAGNVLVSGLFAATAIAMKSFSVIPVCGVLLVFALGMVRQGLAHRAIKAKLNEQTLPDSPERKKAEKIAALRYADKNRAALGFAALGFIVGTFLLLIIGAVSTYYAYAKTYGAEISFSQILWRGVADSWRTEISTVLEFNFLLVALSALAFVFTTVELVVALVKRKSDLKTARLARVYFVLLGGVVICAFASWLAGGVIAVLKNSLLFLLVYGYLPLAVYALDIKDGKEKKFGVAEWALTVVLVVAIVGFALSISKIYRL